jgi:hypothetical protein
MQEQYENKDEFIDDLLLLVDKSIRYRFLEQISLRKTKTFQRKKAALSQFRVRLHALKDQNHLTDEDLKDNARTFFILLLQKNFFTLTYQTWVAERILKELNTNASCEKLRNFLFTQAPRLEQSEQHMVLLPPGNVKYSDLRSFACKGPNDKKRFSLWNRQTTFAAFWKNDSNGKPDYIVPHAERLLLAAKILGIAALLTMATMATLLSLGAGSPLLILMIGICTSALFTCAWSITKKVAKDNIYSNMHPDEERYYKTLSAAAA